MKLKFGIKEVVAIGIGTALFVVLTNAQVPFMVIPNTALQSRVAVLTFFAAVFGPIVGGGDRNHRTCAGRCAVLWKRVVELGIPGRTVRHHRGPVRCQVCD